jgi:hypothetical protein
MKPPGKKKLLRTPDGRPEMRNPDQILKDAAAEISKDLPTKGRKLDLDTYFRSGGEHRVAHRLLKDNGVLPQHLQDRKEAEQGLQLAEEGLQKDIDRLLAVSDQVSQNSAVLERYCRIRGLESPFSHQANSSDSDDEPPVREADNALDSGLKERICSTEREQTLCPLIATLWNRQIRQQTATTGILQPPAS